MRPDDKRRFQNNLHLPGARKCEGFRKSDGAPCKARPRTDGTLCVSHQVQADKAAELAAKLVPLRVVSGSATKRSKAPEQGALTDEEYVAASKLYLFGVIDGTEKDTIQTSQGQIVEKDCSASAKIAAAIALGRLCMEQIEEEEDEMLTPDEKRERFVGMMG